MAEPRQKNVFLTGATSGIGRATADLLCENGCAVWGTSRHPARLPERPHFHPLEMRLEDPASIRQAWARALREAGRIDIVIQNAGSGIFGALEEVPLETARRQWQVLVEGPLQLLQLAAEHLRPRREGLIIGVSSLAAELPMPFSAHYSAGKSAFSALLFGLAMELHPFHVRVVDLRPGDIRTAFNDDLPKTMPPGSPYHPWTARAWAECARLMTEAPAPDLVAKKILRLIRSKKPPFLGYIGSFFQARLGPLGVRLLPRCRLQDSIRRYYGLTQIDDREQPRD